MAQKASPYAIRLGYNQNWNAFFFAKRKEEQINWLKRDKLMRDYLYSLFPDICQLKTEYSKNKITIHLYITEISLVLGENNSKLEAAMKGIYKIVNDSKIDVKVNLIEIKKVSAHAQAIANLVAGELKKRVRFFQVIKVLRDRLKTERENKGTKVEISGRLDGSDNAQTKKFVEGKMKLSSIDSNIKVGEKEVITSYGKIGIKVLVYKGKISQRKNIKLC